MVRAKSVLLVDFDNIYGATGPAFVETLPQWLLWLSDGALSAGNRRRKFLTKRVYWNHQYEVHRAAFEAAGFEAFDCKSHAKSKIAAGTSSADIVMTMDAVQLQQKQPHLEEMILLTTDSDFVPVVNRLQVPGLRVVTAGKETDPTYELYSAHADAVIHIGALKAAFLYERAKRKWYRLKSPPPQIAPLTHMAERRSALMAKVRTAVRGEEAGGKPVREQRLELAADVVMKLGSKTPDQPMARNKVIRALDAVDGFQTKYGKRVKPWLGHRNFYTMMKRLSKINPAIDVAVLPDATVQVICRPRVEAPVRVREATPGGFLAASREPQAPVDVAAAAD